MVVGHGGEDLRHLAGPQKTCRSRVWMTTKEHMETNIAFQYTTRQSLTITRKKHEEEGEVEGRTFGDEGAAETPHTSGDVRDQSLFKGGVVDADIPEVRGLKVAAGVRDNRDPDLWGTDV